MLSIRAFCNSGLSAVPIIFNQPTRNTFILRRRWPPPLHKKGGKPSKLRGRHFVYDLVEDTNVGKKPDIKIILNQFVEGVGETGDVLTLSPGNAYKNFLVPGLAVYANEQNVEKYKVDETKPKVDSNYSSPHVQRTMSCLSRLVLQITMSKQEPWTLEPWHVRTSFRKAGYVVPENAIIMPPIEIKGPDLSLQDKEFYVIVKINNTEEVKVRCRIHHWATGLDKLPWEEFHWKKVKEPLIPEQAEELDKIPLV
ncbi:large ribosomal subunit protein bL9m [Battus philenor]|uniref:large ribosomal subunit protein bL9m n=1 Tax=Battus philenor TaxID=42288 RepID=UPI0035D04967